MILINIIGRGVYLSLFNFYSGKSYNDSFKNATKVYKYTG